MSLAGELKRADRALRMCARPQRELRTTGAKVSRTSITTIDRRREEGEGDVQIASSQVLLLGSLCLGELLLVAESVVLLVGAEDLRIEREVSRLADCVGDHWSRNVLGPAI